MFYHILVSIVIINMFVNLVILTKSKYHIRFIKIILTNLMLLKNIHLFGPSSIILDVVPLKLDGNYNRKILPCQGFFLN